MPSTTISLFLMTLLQQVYAIGYHFPTPPGGIRSPKHHTALLVLGPTCAASTLWAASQSTSSPPLSSTFGLIATVCFLASLALFTWTAITTRPRRFSVIFGKAQPEYVVTHGPYAYIRHPTYVSYALTWIGAMAQLLEVSRPRRFATLVAVTSFGGLMCLFREGAKQEEEEFRNDAKSEGVKRDYDEYASRVRARWVPTAW
ncbi:hypothetical protein NU195Hw_g1416t1 [Hortaea werneckii]